MHRKTTFILALAIIFTMSLSPMVAFSGGDKNTNRGNVGEQIGEPTPDPAEDPEQPRDGDPNPDIENVPKK